MGQYFIPPNELVAIGRRLNPNSYEKLLSESRLEEYLFGLYDRGAILVAPRLSSIQEFNHYENQYRRKRVISRTFWAIPKSAIALGDYGIFRRKKN